MHKYKIKNKKFYNALFSSIAGLFFKIYFQFSAIFNYNYIHFFVMLSKISVRIAQTMSIRNRTQNFFDMNPIHPDHGQKNFDIYNSERKKINVLDQTIKYQKRREDLKTLARRKVYFGNYLKYERYTDGKNFQVDEKTNLLYGISSEFDEFIERYKRDLYVDQTAGSQFKEALLKLIYKYKCKSEVELMKLFRVSIAKSQTGSFVQKLRGKIMKEAVIRASEEKQKQKAQENQSQLKKEDSDGQKPQQEKQKKKNGRKIKIRLRSTMDRKLSRQENRVQKKFNLILSKLDKKIEEAQLQLRYDTQGIPKHLSNYDSKYGWKQTRSQDVNEEYDLDVNVGYAKQIKTSSSPENVYDLQDWSIRTRINRLYFLKRLQYLNKKKNNFDTEEFLKDLPINIRSNDKIMNELAHKYKEQQLIQVPDIQQIHRQVDAAVDKIYVNVSSGNRNNQLKDQKNNQAVYDRAPQKQQFLWENIIAEEILCDTMYNQDSLKNITLTEQSAKKLSPSPNTQLSLLKIPINLYRHTELDSIGMFNQFRSKIGDKLMNQEEMDFQPQFKQFSVQQAKLQYRRIKSRAQTNPNKDIYGRGRRKKAVAQCRIRPGIGIVNVNNKNIQDYFGDTYYRVQALKPLVITQTAGKYDVDFKVAGSGLKGQSECMAYALARALMKINPEFRNYLYYFGLVGSDTRQKEAKKTNLYSARVRPPYVRR